MIKGYYNNTLFNNLGNQNFNNINFDNEKTITMKKCGDGNYQALIRDFDEPDDNEEIEVVQLKNINIDSDNVNILTRFYDIQKGNILIDDVDIKEIDKRDLRKYISIVLQDVFLFSGTVKSNINLDNPEIFYGSPRKSQKSIESHTIEFPKVVLRNFF